MFSILPGSDDVYNNTTNEWDTLGAGQLNFAPNEAYIGWGLYVMQKAEERGVDKAAWDLAAHLGGKDLATWTAIYPSGFQPYRNSHFETQYWVDAGYPPEFAAAYLASQADSYNHPNGADRAAHPGDLPVLRRRRRRSRAGVRRREIGTGSARRGRGAWEEITDRTTARARSSSTRPRSAFRLELARHSHKTSVPRCRRGARFTPDSVIFSPETRKLPVHESREAPRERHRAAIDHCQADEEFELLA